MGRMIKTISLPPHLHEKAAEIKNFSGWVQDRLEEEGFVDLSTKFRVVKVKPSFVKRLKNAWFSFKES